jgi:GNAT superfamily N-acetyltransferase
MNATINEKIYNEFRARALTDYQFELEPLEYKDFVNAVQQGIIQCLVFEDAFLIYTTAISEAVELNVVYAQTPEQFNVLIKMFLDATREERKSRLVCYPMLGVQKEFVGDVCEFGFKFTGSAVLRFTPGAPLPPAGKLPVEYDIVPWDESYTDAAAKIAHEAFKDSPDALFDPRFKSVQGTRDVVEKIVKDVYAKFLPGATSVLLYQNKPVGVCFMNLSGAAANIPIIAIVPEHQRKGLSTPLLHWSMGNALTLPLAEINVTTATNTLAALKMYRRAGFKEDYIYPQAYLENTTPH